VLISVAEKDREQVTQVAERFKALGFRIIATRGTYFHLVKNKIKAEIINKLHQGRPNIEDAIKNKQLSLIINTPTSSKVSNRDDSYVRKAAIKHGVPYLTTLTAALAAATGIEEKKKIKNEQVLSLQEYHKNVR
jgi:carbamoyl-phosphate synthase large subunit